MSGHKLQRNLPRVLAVAVVIGVGLGMVLLVRNMLHQQPPHNKPKVQQISLVQPPPPPPPPEKIDQPPPEQQVQQEVPQDQPPPDVPDAPPDDGPPPGELGLDATGGAGGDSFGLVGRKGGRSLIGGGGGAGFRWYAGVIKQDITDQLSDNDDIRKRSYSLLVKIWIGRDGRVQRLELGSSTGSRELDHAIRTALLAMGRLKEAPPADMPQPVRLRITSRI